MFPSNLFSVSSTATYFLENLFLKVKNVLDIAITTFVDYTGTYADMVFSLLLPYQQDYSNKSSKPFKELETKIREQVGIHVVEILTTEYANLL